MEVETGTAKVGEPLRLLIVSSDTYPPQRVDVRVLFGEELGSRGHRIDWLLQSEAACDRDYVTSYANGRAWVGATDLGESLFHRIRKHVRGIRNDLRMFSVLRSGQHDILQVKDKFLSGIFGILAARLNGVRFVYWLSWPFPEEYLTRASDGTARYPFLYWIRGHVFRVLLYRVLLAAADHIFVQSEQMKKDVAAEGIPTAKMTAVPMGVRIGAEPIRPEGSGRTRIPDGQRCFLYLGTLARVRRMDFIVRVLAHVRRKMPDVKLYVVGKGDDVRDEQALIDEARRLDQSDALVMIGQKPQSEAFEYVLDADVCVSPFYPTPILNSTSPTKLIEYMALGKAVVANDHPEQRLVIGESGAGLCVPYEVEAFGDAVAALLENPARATEMGHRGREYAIRHRSYRALALSVEAGLQAIARSS